MRRPLFVVLLAAVASMILAVSGALAVSGSDEGGEPLTKDEPSPQKQTHSEWSTFQSTHGEGWRIHWNEATAHARLVYGSKTAAPAVFPRDDSEWEALARQIVGRHERLFGTNDQDLVFESVNVSLLEEVGTSDKIGVMFRQQIDGVPVDAGWVSVLFATDASVLAIHAEILPDATDLDVVPRLSEGVARQAASSDLLNRHAARTPEVRSSRLIITADLNAGVATSRLGWEVVVAAEPTDSKALPIVERVVIDAQEGTVLSHFSLVCDADVLGNVEGWATPGTAPDTGSNPEILYPMPTIDVNVSGVGSGTTDELGAFTFSGVNPGTYTVSTTFDGPYCTINNNAGSDGSASGDFDTDIPGTLTFNTSQSEQRAAETNVWVWVHAMRTWMLSVDPSYDLVSFPVVANVNLNNNCNAFYDGSSINFYTSGGGCVNTAYSTVIAHEEGHWLNVLAGSGNGPDGFGEGGADIWAMFLTDDNLVGEDFCGTGCHIRDGNNTRQFCGDENPGCHGGVHANGEVLMGAFWKWRSNLNASLGDAAGDALADALMIAWFKQYDDGQIRTFVRDHLLILDDDDGNIDNGTPHFSDIDGGFVAQGFPAYELQPISFTHTPLPDTNDQNGPYTVVAEVLSNIGASISSVTLNYDVGSGYQTVAMTPTANPDEYMGDIPGQPAPSVVSYYLTASDDQANNGSNPTGAPGAGVYSFDVGDRGAPFFFDDFETDIGWTHSGSGQDDWQRGVPQGKVEDPDFAYSGSNAWANDLGNSGWNGAYSNNVDNNLTSPSIDCTGRLGVRLEFQRWLAVEEGTWDQARIEVSIGGGAFQEVWVNPPGPNLIDTAWNEQQVDISSLADDQSDVRLRFRLTTDTSVTFGGWNIDDIALTSLDEPDDTDPPSGPSDLASPSHNLSEWSPLTNVTVTWTAADDSGSGVDGYSFLWDHNATTTPDTVKDAEEGATQHIEALDSSNDDWYFHIAAVDNAGNWGPTSHFGPIRIDLTAPDQATDLDSPTHDVGTWTTVTEATVTWTAAVDPIGSGLDGYSVVWDQSAGTIPDTVLDIEEGVTSSSTTLSSSDNGWYFHIRAVDNVGNWGATAHFGPLLVDTDNPDAPTGLGSPTHNTGEWSTLTDITAEWNAAADTGSGIDGYSFVWDQSPTTDPDQTKDVEEDTTADSTSLTSSATGWYFHIRSVDNVGLWSGSVHLGPFLIDAIAPNGTIDIEGGAGSTPDLLVDLDLGASDGESGMGAGALMSFSNDGTNWSPEEAFGATKSGWDLSSFGGNGDPGTKTVYVRYRDVAGNLGSPVTDTIDFEPVPDLQTINPATGGFDGGTTVTLTGTGFTPATLVLFGALPAQVTYIDSQTLEVVTPPAFPFANFLDNAQSYRLPVNVTLFTSGGSDVVVNGFEYQR